MTLRWKFGTNFTITLGPRNENQNVQQILVCPDSGTCRILRSRRSSLILWRIWTIRPLSVVTEKGHSSTEALKPKETGAVLTKNVN